MELQHTAPRWGGGGVGAALLGLGILGDPWGCGILGDPHGGLWRVLAISKGSRADASPMATHSEVMVYQIIIVKLWPIVASISLTDGNGGRTDDGEF